MTVNDMKTRFAVREEMMPYTFSLFSRKTLIIVMIKTILATSQIEQLYIYSFETI